MSDALPGTQLLIDSRRYDRRDMLRDARRDDTPARLQEPAPRVSERRDDVLFQCVVAERLGDDDVGGELVAKLGRMAGDEMAISRPVRLHDGRGNACDLRRLEQVDVPGAEL